MTFSSKCSGHYSRSTFYNSANYKKSSHKWRKAPNKTTKSDHKYQQRIQSRAIALQREYTKWINKPRSKKFVNERTHRLKFLLQFIPPKEYPRLSLICLDQQITPESNLFVFGTDKGDKKPYTIWVISNREPPIDLPNILSYVPMDAVLRRSFDVNIKMYPELSESLKGFTDGVTDIFYVECKVKDDPVLVKVLHAFGNFQMCAKDLVSKGTSSNCYLVEQLN